MDNEKTKGLLRKLAIMTLVLIILAIPIVAPNFTRGRCQGIGTACRSNLKNIGTALEMYSTDAKGLYPYSLAGLTTAYLKKVPKCPMYGEASIGDYGYMVNAKRDAFTVFCRGWAHRAVYGNSNFCYTSAGGLKEMAEPVPTREEDAFIARENAWRNSILSQADFLFTGRHTLRPEAMILVVIVGICLVLIVRK